MKAILYLSVIITLLAACGEGGEDKHPLREKIQRIVAEKKAKVGVSIIGADHADTIAFFGEDKFPLQSVFKFHIAMVMLSEIDKGNFTLDQEIEISKDELLPGMYSTLREDFPEGGKFAISRLIEYIITESDNVGCDVLLKLLGGPKKVEAYFHQNGFKNIELKWNEENMQAEWANMFDNWTTPNCAAQLLHDAYLNKNKLLSESSHAFLWKMMKATTTGQGRLRGQLPEDAIVAHKTGSSGTNDNGVTDATNDIGIVFLPDGRYFVITVFVTNSTENDETNEKLIADIAKATWDYYNQP